MFNMSLYILNLSYLKVFVVGPAAIITYMVSQCLSNKPFSAFDRLNVFYFIRITLTSITLFSLYIYARYVLELDLSNN